MIYPAIVLETERLILRPTRPEDFEPLAAFMADDATRFIGGPMARSAAWRGFLMIAGSWTITGYGMFSLIEKSTGDWVGRAGPWVPMDWPGTEVGWGLARSAWGKGYAVEAAVAAIDWAFDHLDWTEVIHCIDPDNLASQKVATRLGSVNRGPGQLPSPLEDAPIEIWGQTREEWRTRRAGADSEFR
jgi:RimJ/RimL family protein N-acetyltransferase